MKYQDVEKSIIYEDNHIICINKPTGILSQPDHTQIDSIIEHVKHYVKVKYNRPGNVYVHPVHRLDRVVSGCLILSRTTKATTRFNSMIQAKSLQKEYLAIVHGHVYPTKARLVHHLVKDNKSNRVKVFDKVGKHTKKAELEYEVLAIHDQNTLLKVRLITGRPHQIRSQLSYIGHPIYGDKKYGSKAKSPIQGIYLHAILLSFIHPVKKEKMRFTSRPHNRHLWQAFESYIIDYK